jgi:hypothetical protein
VTALNQSITASDDGDGSSEQLTGLIETNADIQAGDSGGSLVNSRERSSASTPRRPPDSRSSRRVSPRATRATPSRSTKRSRSPSRSRRERAPRPSTSAPRPSRASRSHNPRATAAAAAAPVSVGVASAAVASGSGSGSGNSSLRERWSATVITSSPAQESGLAEGDTITSLNNQTVSSPSALTNLLEPFHPGDKVTIGWTDTREQSHTASVQLVFWAAAVVIWAERRQRHQLSPGGEWILVAWPVFPQVRQRRRRTPSHPPGPVRGDSPAAVVHAPCHGPQRAALAEAGSTGHHRCFSAH